MIRTMKARLEELEGPGMPTLLMQNPLSSTTNGPPNQARAQQSLVPGSATNEAQNKNQSQAVRFETSPLMGSSTSADISQTLPGPPADTVQHARATTEAVKLTSQSKPLMFSSIRPTTFDALMKPLDVAAGKTYTDSRLRRLMPACVSSSISKPKTSCTCDQCLDILCCDMPIRRQADTLIDIFFSRHNRMFPILHQATFRKQYQWLWGSNQNADSNQDTACLGFCRNKTRLRLFPALLNAVFALGALFAYDEPEQGIAKAEAFFQKAWKVDLLELLDEEAGLEPIQLGLLMSFYLQSAEKFSKCWNTLGLAIRMAQNKGLQFDAAEARSRGLLPSASSKLENEMRSRLWYACVLLDTYAFPRFHFLLHVDLHLYTR